MVLQRVSKLEPIKNIVVISTILQAINDKGFVEKPFGVKKGVAGSLIVIQVTKSAIRYYQSSIEQEPPQTITIDIDNDLCNDILGLLDYEINVIMVQGLQERLTNMDKYKKIKLFQEKLKKMHHDNEWFPF